MDQIVAKQLTRQLKLLNFWVSFFGILFLLIFAVMGVFAYKAYTELHKAQTSISNFQDRTSNDLNVQSQLCNSGISASLKRQSGLCN